MIRLITLLAIVALMVSAPLHHAATAAEMPVAVGADICGGADANAYGTCDACGQKTLQPGAALGLVRAVASGRTAVGRGRRAMPRRRRRAHCTRAPPA